MSIGINGIVYPPGPDGHAPQARMPEKRGVRASLCSSISVSKLALVRLSSATGACSVST